MTTRRINKVSSTDWCCDPFSCWNCVAAPRRQKMGKGALGNYHRAGMGDDATISGISSSIPLATPPGATTSGGGLSSLVSGIGQAAAGGSSSGGFFGTSSPTTGWGAGAPQQSSGSGVGEVIGGILKGFATPSAPAYPGYPGGPLPPGYPYPQQGMSTATKVLLAGGAAVALVMLARR